MIGAQQLGQISAGQQLATVQPGQLATAPGVYATTTGQMTEMLNSIMPLIMMMMVMMMIMPMMKGMTEGARR